MEVRWGWLLRATLGSVKKLPRMRQKKKILVSSICWASVAREAARV